MLDWELLWFYLTDFKIKIQSYQILKDKGQGLKKKNPPKRYKKQCLTFSQKITKNVEKEGI